MNQALSLADIKALDCPQISTRFADDVVIEGVRSILRKTLTSIDGMGALYVFIFACAQYESMQVSNPLALEKGERDYKEWMRSRTLPVYMGSFFKKHLEETHPQAA